MAEHTHQLSSTSIPNDEHDEFNDEELTSYLHNSISSVDYKAKSLLVVIKSGNTVSRINSNSTHPNNAGDLALEVEDRPVVLNVC